MSLALLGLMSLLATTQGGGSSAQATNAAAVPAQPRLAGLTADEAAALIAKLDQAQRRLKRGEFQAFELLAGSIASYDKTKVSPRKAFLDVRFNQVWSIQRVRTDNRMRQPYRLSYAPEGLGKLYWDIEVVLGSNGNIERVLMIYKPPAPF